MSYVFDEYMFMKRRDSVYGTSVMPFVYYKNKACLAITENDLFFCIVLKYDGYGV